jgi:hypothetical protein
MDIYIYVNTNTSDLKQMHLPADYSPLKYPDGDGDADGDDSNDDDDNNNK